MKALLQFLIVIFFGAIAFYVPLQAYARRIQNKLGWLSSSRVRVKTIIIAYLMWYIPVFFVCCAAALAEQGIRLYPSAFLIGAILWVCIAYFLIEQWL